MFEYVDSMCGGDDSSFGHSDTPAQRPLLTLERRKRGPPKRVDPKHSSHSLLVHPSLSQTPLQCTPPAAPPPAPAQQRQQ